MLSLSILASGENFAFTVDEKLHFGLTNAENHGKEFSEHILL